MAQFVPFEKMTKKQKKEYNNSKRVMVGFNTGTQIHKVGKHPTRAQEKARSRREEV